MSFVPTWQQLSQFAKNLAQEQNHCYSSVHDLIAYVPEIDKKINFYLHASTKGGTNQIEQNVNRKDCSETPSRTVQDRETQTTIPYPGPIENNLSDIEHASDDLPRSTLYECKETQVTLVEEPHIYVKAHEHHVQSNNEYQKHTRTTAEIETQTEPKIIKVNKPTRKSHHTRANHYEAKATKKQANPCLNGLEDVGAIYRKQIREEWNSDLSDYEHLKPPPMPLSEYFERFRPDIKSRVDARCLYLKERAEKRKYIASAKMINSLKQMRLGLTARCNTTSPPRLRARSQHAPQYQVRWKLSEHEMKRLTAKVYNSLPEVKEQKKEEVKNHMKVQFYKNKVEYGRKLLENRRHGVINYPLRANYDGDTLNGGAEGFFSY